MNNQNNYIEVKPFLDKYKAVRKTYLWGIVDEEYNVIFPCIYDYIGKRNGKFFVNFCGTEKFVTPDDFPWDFQFIYDDINHENGQKYNIFYNEGGYGVLCNNEIIITNDYLEIRQWGNIWIALQEIETDTTFSRYHLFSMNGEHIDTYYDIKEPIVMCSPCPSQIFYGIINKNGEIIRPAIYNNIIQLASTREYHLYSLKLHNRIALYCFEEDKLSDWGYNKIVRLNSREQFSYPSLTSDYQTSWFKASIINPFQELYSIIYKASLIYSSCYDFDVYFIASEKAIIIKKQNDNKLYIISNGRLLEDFPYSRFRIDYKTKLIILYQNNDLCDVYNTEGKCIIREITNGFNFEPYYDKHEYERLSRHSNRTSSYFLVTKIGPECSRVYSFDGSFTFGLSDIYHIIPINEYFFIFYSEKRDYKLFSIKDKKVIPLYFVDRIERYFSNHFSEDINPIDFYCLHKGDFTEVLIIWEDLYRIEYYSLVTPIIPDDFYKEYGGVKYLNDIYVRKIPNYYFYTNNQHLPPKNESKNKLEGIWGVLNSKGEKIIPCKECVIEIIDSYYFKIDNDLYDSTGKQYNKLEIVKTENGNTMSGTPYDNVNHIFGNIYKAYNKGKCELIKRDGTPLSICNNGELVCQHEKDSSEIKYLIGKSIYKREGESFIKLKYNNRKVIYPNLAICENENGKLGIIDYMNDIVVQPYIYDGIRVFGDYFYVEQNNKYGIISIDGECLTDISLEKEPFEISTLDELVLCRIYPSNYYIFNRKTKERKDFIEYSSVTLLHNQLVLLHDKNSNYYLYDFLTDSFILDTSYQVEGKICEQYLIISSNNHFGVYDSALKQFVLPIMYDKIEHISYAVGHPSDTKKPYLLQLELNSLVGVVNLKTGHLIPCIYDSIIVSNKIGYYIYGINGKYGLMDFCGNCLTKAIFNELLRHGDGLFLANKHDKYGYIDTNGDVIVPFIYDNAYPFIDGLASVGKEMIVSNGSKKDKTILYGLIDKQGKIIINYNFNKGLYFEEGKWIYKNRLYKEAYNKRGEFIPGSHVYIEEKPTYDYEEDYDTLLDALDGEPDAYWNID